jgi:O-antigen ligase
VVALGGCTLLLMKSHGKGVLAGALATPVLAAALWFVLPHETFERLATIPSQLQGGDLNQRINIWAAGWDAFARSPLIGTGAGTFVNAAGTNPIDTAHNTPLSILVGGGLIAFFLATAVVAMAVRAALATRGPIKIALLTALLLWGFASMVDTVEENRTSWLLLGLVAVAGRLAVETPERLEACFAGGRPDERAWPLPGPSRKPAVFGQAN